MVLTFFYYIGRFKIYSGICVFQAKQSRYQSINLNSNQCISYYFISIYISQITIITYIHFFFKQHKAEFANNLYLYIFFYLCNLTLYIEVQMSKILASKYHISQMMRVKIHNYYLSFQQVQNTTLAGCIPILILAQCGSKIRFLCAALLIFCQDHSSSYLHSIQQIGQYIYIYIYIYQ